MPTLKYDGSHPITIEAMVAPEEIKEREGRLVSDARDLRGLGIKVPNGKGQGQFVVSHRSGYLWLLSKEPLMARRRIHVAGILDGREYRFYIDGKLQSKSELPSDYTPRA